MLNNCYYPQLVKIKYGYTSLIYMMDDLMRFGSRIFKWIMKIKWINYMADRGILSKWKMLVIIIIDNDL